MEVLSTLMSLVAGSPTETTVLLAAVTVLSTVWINGRKVDIEGATSIGKLQQEHLTKLMEQNSKLLEQNGKLADDLNDLRLKMAETYTKVDEMRAQIVELEDLVRGYKARCDNCPGRTR